MPSFPQLAVTQPALVFISSASLLSFLALGPSPQFVPLVLLLTSLQLFSRIIIRREHVAMKLLSLWLCLATFISIAHVAPSVNALSTTASAIISLFAVSTMTCIVAAIPFALGTLVSWTRWSELVAFPALWASTWSLVSHISPVGRLVTWSPVQGLGAYSWIRPFLGPVGIDWIVGAWSVVLAQLAGRLILGERPLTSGQDARLISFEVPETIDQSEQTGQNDLRDPPRSQRTVLLTAALGLLALPSMWPALPLPTHSSTTYALSVACALPVVRDSNSALSDFMKETKDLVTRAQVVLWPESAVHFSSAAHKAAAVEEIQNMSSLGSASLIGLGFEDFAPAGDHSRAGTRRNGIMFINRKHGVVSEYFKRNLVPFVESFSLTAYSDSPKVYNFSVSTSNSGKSRQYFPITTSICLDYATTSPFSTLSERPALVLAPARTWHVDVGMAMWEQAKARAAEIDSTLLWCDGGAGGMSGVAGRGITEVMQSGQGSWVRTIGVQMPFDEQATTIYAWGGDWLALAIIWGLLGVGGIGQGVVWLVRRGTGGPNVATEWVLGMTRRLLQARRERNAERAPSAITERAPLLS